jgi:hypothetical protein
MSNPIELLENYFNNQIYRNIQVTCSNILSDKTELNIDEKKSAYMNCVNKAETLIFNNTMKDSDSKI